MTDIINTNRLRVSLFDAKRVAGYPNRSRRCSFHKYRSRDHGKIRPETNIVLDLFDWHLGIKWRPDGKLTADPTPAPQPIVSLDPILWEVRSVDALLHQLDEGELDDRASAYAAALIREARPRAAGPTKAAHGCTKCGFNDYKPGDLVICSSPDCPQRIADQQSARKNTQYPD